MMSNWNQTKEQLLKEIEKLKQKAEAAVKLEKALKAANRQLQEDKAIISRNHALMRSIMDSPVGMIIFALDKNYRYLAFTSSHRQIMKQIWGVDIREGMNMLEVISYPEDRVKAQRNFDRALRGEHLVFEEEYGDEQLLRSYWENRYSPIFNEQNEIIGVSVFVTDISERKLAQQKLEASVQQLTATVQQLSATEQQLIAANQQLASTEQQLRAANQQLEAFNQQLAASNKLIEQEKNFVENLLETAPSFITVLNIDGNISLFNRFAEKLTGYSKEEVAGKNWFDLFIPQKEKDQITEVFSQVLQNMPEYASYENPIILKNGDERIIEWSNTVLKDENGKLTGLMSIGNDITEKRLTETALRQNQAWLTTLINATPDIICFKDGQGRWLIANEADLALFELKDVDYFGKTDAELAAYTHPLYKESFLRCMQSDEKAWKAKGISIMEEAIEKPNGETIFLETIKVPVFDDNGNRTGLVVLGRDVTRRKNMEDALIKSEEKMNTILESSPVGIYVLDDEGKFIYINKAISEITGYAKQEIIGHSFLEFLDEESKDLVVARYRERIAGKQPPSSYRIGIIIKNGEKRTIQINASRVTDPSGRNQVVAYMEDVTEKSKNEQLQQFLYEISKISIKNISLHDYLAKIRLKLTKLINADNFYVALYDAATDTYGFPYHTDQFDRFDEETRVNLKGTITDYVRRTGKAHFNTLETEKELTKNELITPKGTPAAVWLGAPLINSETGEAMGTLAVQDYHDQNTYSPKDLELLEIVAYNIGVFIDRVKTMEELKKAKEKAEESDRLKSAFLANMSHEIRTPMNGILGFTSLLEEASFTGEEKALFIENIKKSGQRLLDTVNDIIDISKIETGQVVLVKQQVNIKEQVENFCRFFQLEAKSKEVALLCDTPDVDGKPLTLETDPVKFGSVLSNLMKNAIKFTDRGSIRVGYAPVKENGRKMVRFYVKDTGIGIPTGRLEAIFNRFEQADSSNTRAFEGSGLGLAISKSYVEMMGGRIWVESTEGQGSQFYFTLPFGQKQPPAPLRKAGHTPEPGEMQVPPLKILIVEDDLASRELLTIILKGISKEMLFASEGEHAVALCRQQPDIDVILMDIRLPGMDGYEITKAIRAFNREVIIIAQTAYALSGDNEKAVLAGCDDYIPKPLNKNRLLSKIRKLYLEKHQ